MKNYFYLIMCTMILTLAVSPGFADDAPKPVEEWTDITDKIFANPIDKGGWVKDDNGKVLANKDGSSLKIETSDFGTILVDLNNKKVVSLDSDNSQKELEVTKLIQREFGLTLVIKTSKFKVRCKMKEKVKGIKNIDGIKAM